MKQFKKQYTALSRDQDDDDIDEQKESVAYGHICVIPLNGEKYDQQTWPHHRSKHVLDDLKQYAGRDRDHFAPICPGQ